MGRGGEGVIYELAGREGGERGTDEGEGVSV